MDEQGCPRCKTTKYRNPSLKLLVNICGHSLCENCVDLLFIKGSGACPDCGTALRRNNFRLQLFEDASVEKEVDIRKRILRDYNKKEEDFQSLKEYNDYLEMVETIVFNLANSIDVEKTRKQIEQYKKENKDQIQKSRSKMSKDEEYLDMLIEHEKHEHELRKQLDMEEELRDKNMKQKNKQALIDELMFSDLPASAILATHKVETAKETETTVPKQAATKFSTGIKWGIQESFLPIPEQKEAEPYIYSHLIMEMCGPDLPSEDDVTTIGYLSNIRETTDEERGGGYDSIISCRRALQDGLCGLFFFPEVSQTGSSQDLSAQSGSSQDPS